MVLPSEPGSALAPPKHVKLPAEDGHAPRGVLREARLAIRRAVHARAGGAGRALRRLRLSTAGLNAVVQALLAPPRFDCAEIAPDIELVDSAELATVLVIDGRLDADTGAARTAVASRVARSTESALRGLLWNEVALAHAPLTGDLAPRVERLLPHRFECIAVPERG